MDIDKIEIEKLSSWEKNALEKILANCDEATILHTFDCSEILSETFGIKNITFPQKEMLSK